MTDAAAPSAPASNAQIDEIRAGSGRIDVVIHAAGVIEDRLHSEKSATSFNRVFDTKVHGARTLMSRLGEDVKVCAFFSSIAAVFGNAGQCDYAAANDVLDGFSRSGGSKTSAHCLSVNWGPWRGAGMVNEELQARHRERAFGLLEPRDAAAAFIDELLCGVEPQVVLSAELPRAFMGLKLLPSNRYPVQDSAFDEQRVAE